MADEHVFREPPYWVVDKGRRGWGLQCKCGWRSPLYPSQDEAYTAAREHAAEPPEEPTKRRWFQRRQKTGPEKPERDRRH